ncbi:hypothetical protein [Thermococcus sp. ES12]|uniref:hypothetical protein n=1 Tax=Thermococcus sp. ES12 TaxID=1638246 RepID=UPI001430E996|nr:hypothetical protein [Thermococcus sp. ES12]NJE77164.1 hypothetical protein [Thermococcus sp. ES12]
MKMRKIAMVLTVFLLFGSLIPLGYVSATYGTVTARDAMEEAKALLNSNFMGSLVSAEFKGVEEQILIATTPAAGFPVEGDSYLIISSGDARYVITGNDSYYSDDGDVGGVYIENGHPVSGADAYDVATLTLKLRVPYGATKLSFRWRFTTDEEPSDDTFQDYFYSYVVFPDGKKVVAATLPNGTIPYVGPIAPYTRETTLGDGVYLYAIMNYTSTAVVDVSQYQGKEITIVFQVADTEDEIVDTAVLIDDLKFDVPQSFFVYNRMMVIAQVWTMYFFKLHDEFDELYANASAMGVDNETLSLAKELHENATQMIMDAWDTDNLDDIKLRLWGAIPTYPKMHLVRRAYVTEKDAVNLLIDAMKELEGS